MGRKKSGEKKVVRSKSDGFSQMERFVGHRLEERFKNPDIENWLQEQRGSYCPDVAWETLVGVLAHGGNEGWGTLERFVKPVPLADVLAWLPDGAKRSVGAILKRPETDGTAKFYQGFKYLIAVFDSEDVFVVKTNIDDRGRVSVSFQPLDTLHVLETLVGVWGRHVDHLMAGLALSYLCDSLLVAIIKESRQAEADFSGAVAVSSDCHRIVCADRLVVLDEQCDIVSDMDISQVRCLANKVRRVETITRCKAERNDDNWWGIMKEAGYVGRFAGSWAWDQTTLQVLIDYPDGSKVFVTHRKYCPDSLFE